MDAAAANVDQNTKVTNYLEAGIKARYIKFYVLAFNERPSMRAGVLTRSEEGIDVTRSYRAIVVNRQSFGMRIARLLAIIQ